jgi:hypothetical protein
MASDFCQPFLKAKMNKNSSVQFIILCLLLLLASGQEAVAAEQQFARLGDIKLEGGGVIRDCVIGYRTFGTIRPDKSKCGRVSDVGRR